MRLLERLRRERPAPWPPGRPVRFITSFNDVLYEASGRRCVQTFRERNPDFEMRAYVEGESATTRRELSDLGADVVRLDDLPLLAEFLEIARDVIPQELGGDAPAEMFPGSGPATGEVWFRKHMYRWFRKIVALDHAIGDFDDVLFWVDCDCHATAPLPLEVIEAAFAGAGVVHMKHKRPHSETGLVGYDLAVPGTLELIAAMREHYVRREFLAYPRWDDCITLDLCLARPQAPRSRDIAGKVLANAEVLPTTPFGPYLTHDKGLHSRGLGLVD